MLCVLIARAAGQPLETFLRDRIFGPLGMKDTGFSVPTSKLGRLVTGYRRDPQSGRAPEHAESRASTAAPAFAGPHRSTP